MNTERLEELKKRATDATAIANKIIEITGINAFDVGREISRMSRVDSFQCSEIWKLGVAAKKAELEANLEQLLCDDKPKESDKCDTGPPPLDQQDGSNVQMVDGTMKPLDQLDQQDGSHSEPEEIRSAHQKSVEQQVAAMPNVPIPPGETIKDMLTSRVMTVGTFAEEMQITQATANALIDGSEPITQDIAKKLSFVIGPSMMFWVERERLYWEALEQQRVNQADAEYLKDY